MAADARSKGSEYIHENFGDAVVEAGEFHGQDWVTVKAGAIHDVIVGLVENVGYDMLEDLTAADYLDRPDIEGRFCVIYHLLSLSRREVFRVKVRLENEETEVPTISDLFGVADWLEREVFDMYGIRFAGHPDLRRILMPEDWEGHPCRRDYPREGRIPIEDPMREQDHARGVSGEFRY